MRPYSNTEPTAVSFRPPGLSPEIMSLNAFPIGNIGEDILLSCILHRRNAVQRLTRVSVTWEKAGELGFVYQYKDGHPEFGNQNEEFQGRTELFPGVLVEGNASLLLRNVRLTDEGLYTCSIDSSGGGGKINLQLRTAGGPTRLSGSRVLTLSIPTL